MVDQCEKCENGVVVVIAAEPDHWVLKCTSCHDITTRKELT